MREYSIAGERHHLTQVLALGAYAESLGRDPQSAKAAACQAFGLSGDLNDELLLCAMLLLSGKRFDEAKQLLLQVGLSCPDKIPAVYAIAACVFKYFNAGMDIRALAEYGIDLVLQLFNTYPDRQEAQQALLDLLLYFGSADDAERVLSSAPSGVLAQEARELQAYRTAQAAGQSHRCKLSVALITYQRPEMLRHTLEALRAALHEQDHEILIGVNDDWPATRQVIEAAGIEKVIYSQANIGLNLYKQLFALAEGEYLLETDDDVIAYPAGFDRQIVQALAARPDLGLVGHWPVGYVDAETGQRHGPAESFHQMDSLLGLPFGMGPVAGVCAGMRRKDYLMINGLSRATLSPHSGEEPQLIRKLSLYGMSSGVFFDRGLWVHVNA